MKDSSNIVRIISIWCSVPFMSYIVGWFWKKKWFFIGQLSHLVYLGNTTYKILSILMHIYGVLPTVEMLCVKTMGFLDSYKYVPFFLIWVTKVISNVFIFYFKCISSSKHRYESISSSMVFTKLRKTKNPSVRVHSLKGSQLGAFCIGYSVLLPWIQTSLS